MGRPLNKKYFGNRNIGSSSVTTDDGIGGQGIAGIALGGANNSTGFSAGTTDISIAAPVTPTGKTAVASLVVGPVGALLTIAAGTSGTDRTTLGTPTGTGVTAAGTFTGLTQKSTNGTGTGAVFTVVKTSGTAYTSTITVTATSKGTGYVAANTVTISGASLGGADGTNDLTFTIGGTLAGASMITGVTITDQGSGYLTAPVVTLSNGTKGTLTVTASLTTNTGAVGSTTYEEAAIIAYAGVNADRADILKQVSKDRYKVTTGSTPFIAKLKTSAAANAADEMTITATDSLSKTYYVKKLTAHKAVLVPYGTNGHEFPLINGEAQQVPWSFATAVTGTVQIDNG